MTTSHVHPLILLPMVLLALAGCSPAEVAPTSGQSSVRLPDASQGTVVETMDSGGYTYMLLQTGGHEIWIAAQQMEVETGDRVEFASAMPMRDFHSSTLNRTFSEILFVAQVRRPDGSSSDMQSGVDLPSGHPPPEGLATARQRETSPSLDSGEMPLVAGALNVAEVYSRKGELAGTGVQVLGKVVKVNSGILGTNWIHIQDGTSHEENSDLLITSSQVPEVGTVVVAEGKVATDRDFGAGYRFPVMIENASLTFR